MDLAAEFRAHERLLWGLGYRMTGLATDADELVQETFVRALEHPVPDDGRPLRPWLVRVCANLARDRLRARRRRAGPHTWLPAPVPDDRLDRVESATVAFLVALDALTPTQRAVLLLRDVFELDVDEVAAALGSSAGAVRVAHHKARRALGNDVVSACRRSPPTGRSTPTRAEAPAPPEAPPEPHLAALAGFLGALAANDPAAALAHLAPDVVLRNDGGGVYVAARMPVRGAEKVLRFLRSVSADMGDARWEVRAYNGRPAVVLERTAGGPRLAPRSVFTLALAADGRIGALFLQLDPRKLGEVAPVAG